MTLDVRPHIIRTIVFLELESIPGCQFITLHCPVPTNYKRTLKEMCYSDKVAVEGHSNHDIHTTPCVPVANNVPKNVL